MTPERWQRIEELYHAADARSANERAAFLAEACRGDEKLRRYVESLLKESSRDGVLATQSLEGAVAMIPDVLPDMIGQSIGEYRLDALLGAGGMGEVYRSRDARLGRDIAIKILPRTFTNHPNRLARFEREARMLAAVNHPNICAIYGFEEADGIRFLILELVEGETLAGALAGNSALPLNRALSIARQIADALEAAHDKGIIHRDLKPANVKITPDGIVKVLDFGLAKAVGGDGASPELTLVPPATGNEESRGAVVGTAAYMSPEQARGLPVDTRTDIWAFGCVLYQMLTGRVAFAGDTVSDSIAKILECEPDWSALPATVPGRIRTLIVRCLVKDPRQRLRDIGEARIVLQESAATAADAAPENHAPRASRREVLSWGLCLAFALAAFALAIGYRSPAPETRVVRASINAPEGTSFRFLSVEAGPVEISPDGRSLAFVARAEDGRNVLFVQALDGLEARPLPGTEGATRPFWSPDGRQLGFFADRQLKKVALDGGAPIPLASTEDPRGGSWNRDGIIVFAPGFVGPLHQVSSAGGQSRPVTSLDGARSETTHRYPHFLPDGKHFLYLARSGAYGPEHPPVIRVASLESPQGKVLVSAPSNPIYASGHLLFVTDGALTAHPFDAARLEMSGEPVRVVDNVQFDRRFGRAVFSASETGILVYQEGTGQGVTQFVWFDRAGKRLGTVAEPAFYDSPELSPDGTRLAARVLDPRTGMGDIWLWDILRGRGRRLTFDAEDDSTGIWSPDGQRILFMRIGPAGRRFLEKPASGAGAEQLVATFPELELFPQSWSADGRSILAVGAVHGQGAQSVWILPSSGGAKVIPFAPAGNDATMSRFSPDGRFIAYAASDGITRNIYVASFPDGAGRWQVSLAGGEEPRWNANGKEIFYFAPDNTLMAATVTARRGALDVGERTPLFRTDMAQSVSWRYDVARDGQRFLVNTSSGQEGRTPITLVINWTERLAKR
jgi:eukaryotic-like serine/threonine-protein kinase